CGCCRRCASAATAWSTYGKNRKRHTRSTVARWTSPPRRCAIASRITTAKAPRNPAASRTTAAIGGTNIAWKRKRRWRPTYSRERADGRAIRSPIRDLAGRVVHAQAVLREADRSDGHARPHARTRPRSAGTGQNVLSIAAVRVPETAAQTHRRTR